MAHSGMCNEGQCNTSKKNINIVTVVLCISDSAHLVQISTDLDNDSTRHSEVPVEPGVPNASSVALHPHLAVSIAHLTRHWFHL